MTRNLFFVVPASLLILTSCNVLAPFAFNNSDNDRLEEAQQCLHDGDFACALENYGQIEDEKLRHQKLCMTYLSKSGFTLSNLINTATSGQSDMMGKLAAGLLPHTNQKFADAEEGKKVCMIYSDLEPLLPLAVLLRTMALLNHCAARVAKTDVLQAISETDFACDTPGNNNGFITKEEISDNADGTLAARGMCKADADACRDDIVLINPALLQDTGLDAINKSYEALPAALKDPASPTPVIRSALRQTLP